MQRSDHFGTLAGALALAVPAITSAQTSQPVQVPLRAEIVSAAQIANTAIEAREGRFGRLGAPQKGFCEYSFDPAGEVTVRDSSGEYGAGVLSPDGCIAPDAVDLPRFELICPAGEEMLFRINSRPGAAKIDVAIGEIAVEGGELQRRGEQMRLRCTDRDGLVTLIIATAFTLTMQSAPGEGDLGALELDTTF